MFGSALKRFARNSAFSTLLVRAAIVGANFVVMIGLAAWLGLDGFGTLVALWSAALVASTVLSLGGPLILLRAATDGGGLRRRDMLDWALIRPAGLGVVVCLALSVAWPALPWVAIIGAGVCINFLNCLASIMRGLGSIQLSMALRDAGPQVLLGVAGGFAGHAGAATLMGLAAILMAVWGGFIGFWCLTKTTPLPRAPGNPRPRCSISLWGTSVLGSVIAQIDLLVGGAMLPRDDLGIYAVLRRVANLIALPVSVATWVSAGPVSAAFGANDMPKLRQASARGSQIAILSGGALFGVGLLCLPFVSYVFPTADFHSATWVFAILLLGALVQVILASSFTVATLCGLARFAVQSRLAAVVIYLALVQLVGAGMSPITNALSYVAATSIGGLLLWHVLKTRIGLDTSAAVLWRAKEVQWKPS